MNLLEDGKYMYWLCAAENKENLEPYQINADAIIKQMPNEMRIDHLEFVHPIMDQMTDMSDWGRVDDMDEFITAFGNENIALALYHYKFLGYSFDDGDSRIPSRARSENIGLAGLYYQLGAKLTPENISVIRNMISILQRYVEVPFTINCNWWHEPAEYVSCEHFLQERCESK